MCLISLNGYGLQCAMTSRPKADGFKGTTEAKKVQTVQGQDQPNRPVVTFKVTLHFSLVCVGVRFCALNKHTLDWGLRFFRQVNRGQLEYRAVKVDNQQNK